MWFLHEHTLGQDKKIFQKFSTFLKAQILAHFAKKAQTIKIFEESKFPEKLIVCPSVEQ